MGKKYKVGYTTGVYDMFHVGHLNLLRRAKEQCDYLIVGVSTDECVKTYKHKTPVIPFEDRKAIVEAIEYVDEVVPQESMDKYVAWKKRHFDVLFHGDDWKGSSMYNDIEEKLKKHGVDFVYFPYTKKISSTKLREELKSGERPVASGVNSADASAPDCFRMSEIIAPAKPKKLSFLHSLFSRKAKIA